MAFIHITHGTGIETDPYLIENSDCLKEYLLSDDASTSGLYFKQTKDITVNDTSNIDNWKTQNPSFVLTNAKYDGGYYDGDNHTIYGLFGKNINYSTSYKNKNIVSFFLSTSYGIKNLTIKDSVYITDNIPFSVFGNVRDYLKNCKSYAKVILEYDSTDTFKTDYSISMVYSLWGNYSSDRYPLEISDCVNATEIVIDYKVNVPDTFINYCINISSFVIGYCSNNSKIINCKDIAKITANFKNYGSDNIISLSKHSYSCYYPLANYIVENCFSLCDIDITADKLNFVHNLFGNPNNTNYSDTSKFTYRNSYIADNLKIDCDESLKLGLRAIDCVKAESNIKDISNIYSFIKLENNSANTNYMSDNCSIIKNNLISKVNDCYTIQYDGDEQTFADNNVELLTKEEFSDEDSFTDWDFDNVWVMKNNRPQLINNSEYDDNSSILFLFEIMRMKNRRRMLRNRM